MLPTGQDRVGIMTSLQSTSIQLKIRAKRQSLPSLFDIMCVTMCAIIAGTDGLNRTTLPSMAIRRPLSAFTL